MPVVPALLAPWVLVFCRTMGLSMTAPAWGTPGLGARLRVALAVLLAVMLGPVVAPGLLGVSSSLPGLVWACLAEAAVGAGLGMAMALVVAGARQAGEIVSAQAGLSAASLFDPDAGSELTPLGQLYGLVAIGTFLAIDGPLRLVAALVESYRIIPAGSLPLSEETARIAFARLGQAMLLALKAASPVALALAVAGLALGLLARAAPTFQFLSLALPVRSGVGLFLVLLGLATLAATLSGAWLDLDPLDALSRSLR